MSSYEIIAALATSLGVSTFAAVFTILYRGYCKASVKELKTGKRDIELLDDYVYGSIPAVKIRRRVWSVVKGILFYGFLILLIPIFVFSILNKLQGNVMMLGSRSMMVVASGSMSEKHQAHAEELKDLDDQLGTYDVIFIERVERAEELEQYDVIAFVDDTGKNVIHRIVRINSDGTYETRGDANAQSDPYAPCFEDVIGVYTGVRIPVIGSFVLFFQSIGGIVTLAALFYCLIMLDRYNAKIEHVERERLEQLCESIDLDLDKGEKTEICAEFKETLYYKGCAYHFNEKGFVDKDDITDASYLERSDSVAIRVLDTDGERKETEVQINSEEGDDTP